jgi:uncharacterized protein YukE
LEIIKRHANNHLKLKLESLISKTEEIYLKMGRSFPELFKELESGFKESGKLVSFFSNEMNVDEKREGCVPIADIIEKAKEEITGASDFFIELGEKDRTLFASITRGIENLNSLDARIESIRDDSIEIKLISLNAMVTALKAGKNGRGYSYITDELNKLSSRTVTYTKELAGKGEDTLGVFNTLKKRLDSIQSFQRAFYGDFQKKLNSSFESYNQGLKKLTDTLLNVIDEAKGVKKPLYRIMEEVQLQDIIRQSVMHVIISLREIEMDFSADSSEHFLDEMSFSEKVADLCINLLDNVQAMITKSQTVFRENFSHLRQIMRNVEGGRADLLDYFNAEESGKPGRMAINEMFSESIKALEELMEGINRSMDGKKGICRDGTLIIERLKMIDVSFQSFFEIVNSLYCIKVFSRIEIATQSVLKGQSTSIREMTRLIFRIDEDIKEALSIIDEAMRRTNNTVSKYAEEMAGELIVVNHMTDRIKESYDMLISSKNTLSNNLQSFSVYTDRFSSLLDDSENDIDRLLELTGVIEEIREGLRLIRADAEERKKAVLKKRDMGEWKIVNDKMKDMIERFTIFTHKETAGAIGGFEVEKGSEEGELTLF